MRHTRVGTITGERVLGQVIRADAEEIALARQVLGSVVLFGLIVTHLGLVLSTIVLIVLASVASHEFRPKEAFISAILLAALAVGVFVIGLKLQLPIWPWSN